MYIYLRRYQECYTKKFIPFFKPDSKTNNRSKWIVWKEVSIVLPLEVESVTDFSVYKILLSKGKVFLTKIIGIGLFFFPYRHPSFFFITNKTICIFSIRFNRLQSLRKLNRNGVTYSVSILDLQWSYFNISTFVLSCQRSEVRSSK